MTGRFEMGGEVTPLSAEEMGWLLRRARSAVLAAVSPELAVDTSPNVPSARLRDRRGCFVTLTRNGALRGCIGNVLPRDPLHLMIVTNARSAALHDPRFSPVTASELDELTVEVSILTDPAPLAYSGPDDLLQRLVPHRDGVFLRIGSRAATFLPQVWEKLPDPQQFLNRLAEKAGCAADAWRAPDVEILTYTVQCVEEDGAR